MVSMAYSLIFLAGGLGMVRALLPTHRPLNRWWLGLSLGILLEMWLPAAMAFLLAFDAAGHAFAALLMILLTLLCFLVRDPRPVRKWDDEETRTARSLLAVTVPLTVLGAWLQYTHVMRVDEWGGWHVGQSTYGDLPMHLSFITGLVGRRFPADYPFYPGARLSYPFLTDSLSSTWLLTGSSLQVSAILPAVMMMFLCYTGVMILGRDLTGGRKAMVLAALLFFLNGGLGFLYDFDQAGGLEPDGEWTVSARIRSILTGYYKTPTNQPEPNNLRWSNVICDLMVPQRTLLGGWCMVIPCFYLLDAAFRPRRRGTDGGIRATVLLGIWAGSLPLIHTHSFLALGLASMGAAGYDLIHGDPGILRYRRRRLRILADYAVYGGIAAALALPQLIGFTFSQTFQEGGHSFLALQFNWVNNPSGRGMRDLYFWFYLKNIGLPFAALLLALFEKKPRWRRLFAMALPIILAAELIRFQPNEYDNNKLFYLAWLLCCMIVADWTVLFLRQLTALRSRRFLAAVTAVAVFLSAGLTLWRECVSDYVAFRREAVEAGLFARDRTDRDAVFLTGTQHLNPVLSLAGRRIVCGPDLWLYWHGFDTEERKAEIEAFYEDPRNHTETLTRYGVDYIYVSSYERSDYAVDEQALAELFPVVFENAEATLFRVPGKTPGQD